MRPRLTPVAISANNACLAGEDQPGLGGSRANADFLCRLLRPSQAGGTGFTMPAIARKHAWVDIIMFS